MCWNTRRIKAFNQLKKENQVATSTEKPPRFILWAFRHEDKDLKEKAPFVTKELTEEEVVCGHNIVIAENMTGKDWLDLIISVEIVRVVETENEIVQTVIEKCEMTFLRVPSGFAIVWEGRKPLL